MPVKRETEREIYIKLLLLLFLDGCCSIGKFSAVIYIQMELRGNKRKQ